MHDEKVKTRIGVTTLRYTVVVAADNTADIFQLSIAEEWVLVLNIKYLIIFVRNPTYISTDM